MTEHAFLIGAAETPYTRHPGPGESTAELMIRAARGAVRAAGLAWSEVDGFGASSFTLAPDHAIDLAWRAGLGPLRWLGEDTNGGASGINLLANAAQAVREGAAETIVLVSGDRMDGSAFGRLVAKYNRATEQHLTPLPMTGPNALFALLTQRQMRAYGLSRRDYGSIVISQRQWAAENPGAVYRSPLSMEQYLSAPEVSTPLGRYDCVPPVTGADAIVVTSSRRAVSRPAVRVRAVESVFNWDDQDGDGLTTGLIDAAPRAWESSGIDPGDVDLVSVYDDYPAMAVAQLVDAGFIARENVARDIAERVASRALPVNTSGGQLSAGQAGAAAGMHGLVEAFRQLSAAAGRRQVDGARLAAVTGYGMVLYRYGACANIAVLETSR